MQGAARAEAEGIQAISDWLIREGLLSAEFEDILTEFCERLVAFGMPLQRVMIGMRTLHPSIDAVTYTWQRGGAAESANFVIDQRQQDGWQRSPLHHMLETDTHDLRRRLAGPGADRDFPILEELAAQGATDYLARLTPFDLGTASDFGAGMLSTWATDRAEGFTDHHVSVLDRLIPRLALTAKGSLTRQIAVNVLDTYVGPDAGHRIMAGDIRRGSMEVIRAVLLYADLRGFTAVTDRADGDEVAAMLDEYFEAMVPPVLDHGGEVLKYLGDGLLATFNLAGRRRDTLCSDALQVAHEQIVRVRELNVRRGATGRPVMELDTALHLGDVLYGNVGAADRLDFTVIGPAVNEASRIEALCAPLGLNVLISEAFSAAAAGCTDRLISAGRHKLRGVRESQQLYTIDTSG